MPKLTCRFWSAAEKRSGGAPCYAAASSTAACAFRNLMSEMMCRTIQNGTAKVGIMLSGSSSRMSVVTSPRRIPMGELPLSTPPPMAPTKSSRPRTLSRTTCLCQPGGRRSIARTTNGAYAPTMRSPIPAGHANVPGKKPNDMRTRNIAPMTRHACIAVNRRRSRLSESVRTFAEKQYPIAKKIGGPITEMFRPFYTLYTHRTALLIML
jgi:hypothetical protein